MSAPHIPARFIPRPLRAIFRRPAFALLVTLTVSTGVGLTTAVYAVVDRVLWPDLPFKEADRLLHLTRPVLEYSQGLTRISDELRIPQLAGIGLYQPGVANLGHRTQADRVRVAVVDPEFFHVIGVAPVAGRTFSTAELAGPRVAVVSSGLWQRRLALSSSLEDARLYLNDRRYTVVGIMPPSFTFPDRTEVWIPLGTDSRMVQHAFLPAAVARVAPGYAVVDAISSLEAPEIRRLGRRPRTPPAIPLHLLVARHQRSVVLICGWLATLLLVATCANTAGLWLSRMREAREHFAVRLVLGASPLRLWLEGVAQPAVLSVIASLGGIAIATGALRGFAALVPGFVPSGDDVGLDARTWIVGSTVAGLITISCSLVPLFTLRRGVLQRSKGASTSFTASRHPLNVAVVVVQSALALLLLVGAFTAAISIRRSMEVDLGFSSGDAFIANILLSQEHYPHAEDALQYVDAIGRAISERLPNAVVGATNVGPGPPRMLPSLLLTASPGTRGSGDSAGETSGLSVTVSPDYFRAAGIALIAGRAFSEVDYVARRRLLVISESVAKAIRPDIHSLIGQTLTISEGSSQREAETIGVVADVRPHGPNFPVIPMVYQPLSNGRYDGMLTFVLSAGPKARIETIAAAFAAVDPQVPIGSASRISELNRQFLRDQHVVLTLVTVFSIVTALLGCVGVYGVSALAVLEKQAELGIMLVLGAPPFAVLTAIWRTSIGLVSAGLIVGLALIPLVFRPASVLLPGFEGPSASVSCAAAGVLLFAGLAAGYIPARWGLSVNPLEVIRNSVR